MSTVVVGGVLRQGGGELVGEEGECGVEGEGGGWDYASGVSKVELLLGTWVGRR